MADRATPEPAQPEPAPPDVMLDGPRPARWEERDRLVDMLNAIFRLASGRPPTIGSDWTHVFSPENIGRINVVCDTAHAASQGDAPRGKLVASAGVWVTEVVMGHATLRVGGINCVGTLPEYRRHGLGNKVMAAAHQTMADLGCHVGLLSTGIASWYRRMGWEEAGCQRIYRLNRGNITLLPALHPDLRLRWVKLGAPQSAGSPTTRAQLEAVAAQVVRLRAVDRLGARRDVARFCELATARQVEHVVFAERVGGPNSETTSGETGKAVAYLLVNGQTVIEWGGAAADVAGLVRASFATLDDPHASTTLRPHDGSTLLRTLAVVTPGWAHPLTHPLATLLDALRIPYTDDYLGMLLLLEPQALLDAFGVENVRVTRAGDRFVLEADGAQVTLDHSKLTKHFFGPERVSDLAADRLPLPFWQWGIERV